MKVDMVLQANDVVGESIVWDDRTGHLVWVDIVGKRIHRLAPAGAGETWETPDFVTSIGLRQDGGAIVGLSREVALWDFGGPFRALAVVEPDRPENRLNEGVVGPDGAYWVGTMQNNLNPDGSPRDLTASRGAIYRVEADGGVTRLSEPTIGLTNTFAWTQDGRFITADTLVNEIYAYNHDRAANTITGRGLFAPPFARGLPDGSCLDREGYLWNCRVAGGACLVRYSPDGDVDRVVELPCSWPTSCTFGGDDLSTLYVTSARFTMTPEHLAAKPLEGGLFCLRPGVAGRPENRFGC